MPPFCVRGQKCPLHFYKLFVLVVPFGLVPSTLKLCELRVCPIMSIAVASASASARIELFLMLPSLLL